MKKIKLRYKILIGILIIILLIPPFNYFVLKDSVMEDIYRSVNRSYYNINKFEGINTLDYEDIEGQLWMNSNEFLFTNYEDDYLADNFNVYLFFSIGKMIDEYNVKINGLYFLSDNISVNLCMSYNHATRTMTYSPMFVKVYEDDIVTSKSYFDEATVTQYLTQYGITQEDIKEYQHYILYDVVYQSWVSGTDNGRKLNKWDYLNIKEVDNTFHFDEQTYQN